MLEAGPEEELACECIFPIKKRYFYKPVPFIVNKEE